MSLKVHWVKGSYDGVKSVVDDIFYYYDPSAAAEL